MRAVCDKFGTGSKAGVALIAVLAMMTSVAWPVVADDRFGESRVLDAQKKGSGYKVRLLDPDGRVKNVDVDSTSRGGGGSGGGDGSGPSTTSGGNSSASGGSNGGGGSDEGSGGRGRGRGR